MPARESRPEKLDRELQELLQELRVVLPGVQVLFAFLLAVPFTERFDALDSSHKGLFLAALVNAAVASALLIAPSAFHRILFRERDKEWMIKMSNRLAITGMVFLAIAMTCALYLVADVIYGVGLASPVAAAIGLLFLVVWYVVPLARRTRNSDT